MLSENDYNILKQYETQLKTSQVGYIRGLYSKDIEILKDVCDRYGIKLTNKNCSSCVLGVMKQLSNLYFTYQQSIDLQPKLKIVTKKTKNKK